MLLYLCPPISTVFLSLVNAGICKLTRTDLVISDPKMTAPTVVASYSSYLLLTRGLVVLHVYIQSCNLNKFKEKIVLEEACKVIGLVLFIGSVIMMILVIRMSARSHIDAPL